MSITSVLCLITLGLTDEVIGVHFLPISKIYAFTSSSFVISSIIISALLYGEINKFKVSLKDCEKKTFVLLRIALICIGFLLVFDILQWKYAYSDWKGKIFNENSQAMCEWAIVVIAILLPPIYSKFFRDSNLSFMLKKEKKTEREIELSEVSN
jgi:hypothetical protein